MTQQLAPGSMFKDPNTGAYHQVEQDGSLSMIRPTPELAAQLDAAAAQQAPQQTAAQQTVMPGAAAAAGFVPPVDVPDAQTAQAAQNPQGGVVDSTTGQVSPHAAAPQAQAQTAAPQAGQVGLGNMFGATAPMPEREPLVAAGITTAGPPVGTPKTAEQTAAAVVPAPEAPAYAQTHGDTSLTDDLASTASGVRVPRLRPHDMNGFIIEHAENTVALNTNEMEIVILAGGPKVKVMYPGAYQPGVKSKPICKSSNGVVPDADSPQPQCATCAACPMNQFGSHPGGKGKRCKDRRRLAVIDLRDPNMVMQMDLPVMHTLALGDYAQHLARSKGSVEWAKTVVRSKRAEGMSWMELEFVFNGWLTEEEMAVIDATKTSYDDLIRAATDPGGRASGANLIAHQQAPAQIAHTPQEMGQTPAPQTVQAAAPAQQAAAPAQQAVQNPAAQQQMAGAASLGFAAGG